MSVCVYYSLGHLFSRHGGGCWEKWELQCLYVYIIPWSPIFPTWMGLLTCMCILFPITYFGHGGDAQRNENCNVCMCILFPWSPISPNMEGVAHINENLQCMYVYIIPLINYFSNMEGVALQKWELQCLCVYIIPMITYFPKHGGGCSQKRELQCLYVYTIPLVTYFPKHGGGCSQKWELQCMYMYKIPLITYFPNMEELLTEMRIAMYICILFPWSPISPTWRVAHRNEDCNVCRN